LASLPRTSPPPAPFFGCAAAQLCVTCPCRRVALPCPLVFWAAAMRPSGFGRARGTFCARAARQQAVPR